MVVVEKEVGRGGMDIVELLMTTGEFGVQQWSLWFLLPPLWHLASPQNSR
jgi:hypothetical protein